MKQNKTNDLTLSLNKTTIARLQKSDLKNIKAGVGFTVQAQIDESCGYACGDCMSLGNFTVILPSFLKKPRLRLTRAMSVQANVQS